MPEAELSPIPKKSAETQAIEALRAHLLSRAEAPGNRLTEAKLSAALGVARATVRTALHQLCREGLVEQIPYTGWRVARLSAHDAWELYTLRSGIEALAARLAVRNLDPGGEAALHAAFDRLARACAAGNRQDTADADFALHKEIIRLSGHKRLAEQYRLVEQQIRAYIAASDALPAELALIAEQHRPIMEAVISRDGARAARLSEGHNLKEGEILIAHLQRIESGAATLR